MHVFLLMRMTGLGKGRPQHMSKLHDNADMQGTRGVCALRALVSQAAISPKYMRNRKQCIYIFI